MLSDGAMSPTMHSAISWTRAIFMHLWEDGLFILWRWLLFFPEKLWFKQSTIPNKDRNSFFKKCIRATCLCLWRGQWWSETSWPCGTCGPIHSRVSSPSCTPSRSVAPSAGNIRPNVWVTRGKSCLPTIWRKVLSQKLQSESTSSV